MGEHKTSERRLRAIERQRKALELRTTGKSFRAITTELKYRGPSGAYKAVMSALRRTLQEPADELRQLELDRLDELMTFLWPEARLANYRAIEGILGIMGRRAKLLGLDAPLQVKDVTEEHPLYGKSVDEIAAVYDFADHFTQGDRAFLEEVTQRLGPPGDGDQAGGDGEDPAKD